MRKLSGFDLQRFAEGSEPNTGGTGGTDPNTNPDAGGGGGSKVTFTPEQQAHIDALVAQRLSRAEKSQAKKVLETRAKELGFETVEAMEAALAAHKDAAEKDKTDLQKAQEALAAEKAKTAQAEAKAKAALVRSAFTAEAVGANLVNVADAFKLADLTSVDVADDGTVAGVKEAVEQLVKDKPYLVKQDPGTSGGSGGAPFRQGGDLKPDDITRQILARQGIKTEQRKSAFWG